MLRIGKDWIPGFISLPYVMIPRYHQSQEKLLFLFFFVPFCGYNWNGLLLSGGCIARNSDWLLLKKQRFKGTFVLQKQRLEWTLALQAQRFEGILALQKMRSKEPISFLRQLFDLQSRSCFLAGYCSFASSAAVSFFTASCSFSPCCCIFLDRASLVSACVNE